MFEVLTHASEQTFEMSDYRLPESEQWTLQLAFEGFRLGMDMAEKEKGPLPVFAECRRLFDEAYAEYLAGRMKEGYAKLGEVKKLLRTVPTW